MEQRNRGIDLLRMAAMWMVVILHILNIPSYLRFSTKRNFTYSLIL